MQICEAFGANRYPFPDDPTRARQMLTEVSGRIRELSSTLDHGQRHRNSLLLNIAQNLEVCVFGGGVCVSSGLTGSKFGLKLAELQTRPWWGWPDPYLPWLWPEHTRHCLSVVRGMLVTVACRCTDCIEACTLICRIGPRLCVRRRLCTSPSTV